MATYTHREYFDICLTRCDALAVVEVEDMRKETKPIKRNNNPRWESTFSFNVTKADEFLEVRSG